MHSKSNMESGHVQTRTQYSITQCPDSMLNSLVRCRGKQELSAQCPDSSEHWVPASPSPSLGGLSMESGHWPLSPLRPCDLKYYKQLPELNWHSNPRYFCLVLPNLNPCVHLRKLQDIKPALACTGQCCLSVCLSSQMDTWIQIRKNKTKIARIGMLIQFWKLFIPN